VVRAGETLVNARVNDSVLDVLIQQKVINQGFILERRCGLGIPISFMVPSDDGGDVELGVGSIQRSYLTV